MADQYLPDDLVTAVKNFEGYNPNAYSDYKQTSVGYGTVGTPGQTITPDQADAALRGELAKHASAIDSTAQRLGVTLTPGQRNALISFSYNTGAGPRVLQQSGGDLTQVPGLMAQFTHVTNADGSKSVLPGLVNRRTSEIAMFGSGAAPIDPNQPLTPLISPQPVPLQTANNPVASIPTISAPAKLLPPVINTSVKIANSLPSLFYDPTVSGL